MSKTYRKDNGRAVQKAEPYPKRIKNDSLDRFKGISSREVFEYVDVDDEDDSDNDY